MMINKLKERFSFIDVEEIWPYLENVVNRMPDKIQKTLLENKKIEILTTNERSIWIVFRNPIESLIYLNWERVSNESEKRDLKIKFGIAHEIAHHFAGRGKTGLMEMEAENLMRKWGFEKEIEAADYSAPKFERKGYNIGYVGAKNEFSHSGAHWLSVLEDSMYYWENEDLTIDQKNNLIQFINFTAISEECNKEIEDDNIKDENLDSYMNGIFCGIMHRVKELKERGQNGKY